MIDFEPFHTKRLPLQVIAEGLDRADLAAITREMTARILGHLADCTDADVTFMPVDPDAFDRYASTEADRNVPWSLGHVVVHLTASCEEAAFLGAELARGVPAHGRSRYEVPWPTVTTIEACRERLRESERMCLATLETWPDRPHLDVFYEPLSGSPPRNAVARYLGGPAHADEHRDHIPALVRQATAARSS